MGATVSTRSSLPVECQKPTVPAEKSISAPPSVSDRGVFFFFFLLLVPTIKRGRGKQVDLRRTVRNIMPYPRREVGRPLTHTAHLPPQVAITHIRLPRDPPRLHLREVALKETNLVLPIDRREIRGIRHHGEVVPHFARVDRRRRLRNQLGPPHGLALPVRRGIERELGALLGRRVGRVLVRGGQVDVLGDVARPVDVVLVRADFVGPGPVVEVARGGEVVEAAIPEDGAGVDAG